MDHLIFFVDPAWRRANLQHSPLLFQFWGNPLTDSVPFWKELFDKRGYDTRYYSITDDIAAADMVLMPYSHTVVRSSVPELLETCIAVARAAGKKLLIDGLGDVEYPIPFMEVIVLRYGGYRFLREPNAVQIPPYADDLLEIYREGKLSVSTRGEKPVVGFAGWASLPLAQTLRTIFKELPIRLRALVDERYWACRKGVFFRKEAIAALRSSNLVISNFIIRESFSANRRTMSGTPETLRQEFVDNLLNSDYGLCVRGDANASVRLFETLALGRIPVIVDTECLLPFDRKVDYRSFSIIVDFRDIRSLPRLLADFHAKLSSEELSAMQKRAREAYVNFFRIDALMPHILEELRAAASRLEKVDRS